ncbi:MAG: hypothetical protein AAGJ31_06415 [Verrucomicrobiota bacterium]
MSFERMKEVWQQQATPGEVTIGGNALLNLVRRNHRNMESLLLRRDFIEVTVALLLVPIWIWMGTSLDLLWTWYLVIPGVLWVAGFLIVDRLKQRGNRPQPGDPLRDSIEQSLAQIRHQINLLRNVFWWYLFPIALPLIIYTAHDGWLDRDGWGTANGLIFYGLVVWGVYELNQWTVRKKLEPEREELQDLLASLPSPESAGKLSKPENSQ